MKREHLSDIIFWSLLAVAIVSMLFISFSIKPYNLLYLENGTVEDIETLSVIIKTIVVGGSAISVTIVILMYFITVRIGWKQK